MIGIGAVIRDGEGKILFAKHKVEHGGFWQGKWICPGGGIVPGETLVEGALREVREETQIPQYRVPFPNLALDMV